MKKIVFLFFAVFCLGIGAGKAQYTILHSFNDTLGGHPLGSLQIVGNSCYGMTSQGGTKDTGVLFSIDTDGSNYNVLYNFNGILNGAEPVASLNRYGNRLYGTTSLGGTNGTGIIFSTDTNGGDFKVLFQNFTGGRGAFPYATLIGLGGKLFGTTYEGGANQEGALFSIDTSGNNFKTLWSLDDTNGMNPFGSLVFVGRTLFGMAQGGGKYTRGVIFSIDSSGSNYKVLYNFNVVDFGEPTGALTPIGNILFGMTENGGVIFKIDTDGSNYTILHTFSWFTGAQPQGSLTLYGNKFYSMTNAGGTFGDGVIFSIDTDGNNYNVKYSFSRPDGSFPNGDLIFHGNVMYGMTNFGGTFNDGVVFSFKDTTLTTSANYNESNSSFLVYPNPSTGIFTIDLTGSQNFEPKNIEIYSVLDQKVNFGILKQVQHDCEIDLSSQPNGVYFYRVVSESGGLIGEGKVVIEK